MWCSEGQGLQVQLGRLRMLGLRRNFCKGGAQPRVGTQISRPGGLQYKATADLVSCWLHPALSRRSGWGCPCLSLSGGAPLPTTPGDSTCLLITGEIIPTHPLPLGTQTSPLLPLHPLGSPIAPTNLTSLNSPLP